MLIQVRPGCFHLRIKFCLKKKWSYSNKQAKSNSSWLWELLILLQEEFLLEWQCRQLQQLWKKFITAVWAFTPSFIMLQRFWFVLYICTTFHPGEADPAKTTIQVWTAGLLAAGWLLASNCQSRSLIHVVGMQTHEENKLERQL